MRAMAKSRKLKAGGFEMDAPGGEGGRISASDICRRVEGLTEGRIRRMEAAGQIPARGPDRRWPLSVLFAIGAAAGADEVEQLKADLAAARAALTADASPQDQRASAAAKLDETREQKAALELAELQGKLVPVAEVRVAFTRAVVMVAARLKQGLTEILHAVENEPDKPRRIAVANQVAERVIHKLGEDLQEYGEAEGDGGDGSA